MAYLSQYVYLGGEFFNHSTINMDQQSAISDPFIMKFDKKSSDHVKYDQVTIDGMKKIEDYFSYSVFTQDIALNETYEQWQVDPVQFKTIFTIKNITESRCFGKKSCQK